MVPSILSRRGATAVLPREDSTTTTTVGEGGAAGKVAPLAVDARVGPRETPLLAATLPVPNLAVAACRVAMAGARRLLQVVRHSSSRLSTSSTTTVNGRQSTSCSFGSSSATCSGRSCRGSRWWTRTVSLYTRHSSRSSRPSVFGKHTTTRADDTPSYFSRNNSS